MNAYYEARAVACRRAAKRSRIASTVMLSLAAVFLILGIVSVATSESGLLTLAAAALIAVEGFYFRRLAVRMDGLALRFDRLAGGAL